MYLRSQHSLRFWAGRFHIQYPSWMRCHVETLITISPDKLQKALSLWWFFVDWLCHYSDALNATSWTPAQVPSATWGRCSQLSLWMLFPKARTYLSSLEALCITIILILNWFPTVGFCLGLGGVVCFVLFCFWRKLLHCSDPVWDLLSASKLNCDW